MAPVETPTRRVSPVPAVAAPAVPTFEDPVWLPHYQPGYPYQPEHLYTLSHTTDPYYVVEDVSFMGNNGWHADVLYAVRRAEDWWLPDTLPDGGQDMHSSWDKSIRGIPGHMLARMPRHTGSVSPDMALWGFATTPAMQREGSYDFAVWGAPLLVLEVVSASTRHQDVQNKRSTYAQMGVLEYWIMDEETTPTLTGYTLYPEEEGGPPLSTYRRILPAADGSLYSTVLGRHLRGAADHIQGWHEGERRWIDLRVIADVEQEAAQRSAEQQAADAEAARTAAERQAASAEAARTAAEQQTASAEAARTAAERQAASAEAARTAAEQQTADTEAKFKAERIASLLEMAHIYGAFATASVQEDYRQKLLRLALDRIPSVQDLVRRLPTQTEEPRAAFIQRFLDAAVEALPPDDKG